jgi:hypothetical protein
MESKPKQVFNLGDYLESKGYIFNGVGADGTPKFLDPEGKSGEINIPNLLTSLGVDPKTPYQVNKPGTALDESPVELLDRMKLGLGNTAGNVDYLSKKFEKVAVDENNGITVRDKGVWKKIDPEHFDAWEITNDVLEGAVKWVPSAAGAGLGAAAGLVSAGPVGSMAGAGYGGAAAELLTSSLGRLAGTYKATPEEQLKDIGLEFALNAGGQAVAVGAKPLLSGFKKAFKFISEATGADKVGQGASDVIRNSLATVLGKTTGAGAQEFRTMIDQTDEVFTAFTKSRVGARSTEDIVANAVRQQVKDVDYLIKEAPRALSRRFRSLVDDLVDSVDDDAVVDIGRVAKGALEDLTNSGYGKFVADTAPQMAKIIGLAQDGLVTSPEQAKKVFRLLTNEESLKRIMGGKEGHTLVPEARKALDGIVDLVNELGTAGTASGKDGAKALMQMKANINQLVRDLDGTDTPPAVLKFAVDLKNAFLEKTGQTFANLGVAEKYVETSNLYSKFADAVHLARVTQKKETSQGLLNKMFSKAGNNQEYKDWMDGMAELSGAPGAAVLNRLKVYQAAKSFAPIAPKPSLGLYTGSTIGAGAVASGLVNPMTAVGAAALTSPRAVFYGKRALDFMRALPKDQRLQWLQSPTAIRETFKAVMDPIDSEDQNIEDMLKQAGVK